MAINPSNKYKIRIISLLVIAYFMLFVSYAYAQVPEKIRFQTTVKDANGNVLANKEVGARIKIIDQNSEIFYQERHVLLTNDRGLASFTIGDGDERKGKLSDVFWANRKTRLYIKVEIDPTGGKIYTLISYNRIHASPFALQAKYVETIQEEDPLFMQSIGSNIAKRDFDQLVMITRERHYPGDWIGGGIVFYVDPTGENGLLASPFDISTDAIWQQPPLQKTNAISISDGAENTQIITDQSGPGSYSAYHCDTLELFGNNDWYLPSGEELSMLFNARYELNKTLAEDDDDLTAGIWSDKYWSSTEKNTDSAILYVHGEPALANKQDLASVRAIRKFSGLYDVRNYSWKYLGGPEEENGDPVQIIENNDGDLLLDVDGSRGTVCRALPPTTLPVKITFRMKTVYDPDASEPPYLLFGTGDFRLYFGGPNKTDNTTEMIESNLGEFEGVQFRIHPHLDESPIRRYTGSESHTCTSIWIRYVDPDRILGAGDEPHTGLLSDACQNRNKPPTHNCGWARVGLFEDGFGLDNGEETYVTVVISQSIISLDVNGRTYTVDIADLENDNDYQGDILRFDQVTNFAIGHTNISRGYETIRISDLRIMPLDPQ